VTSMNSLVDFSEELQWSGDFYEFVS